MYRNSRLPNLTTCLCLSRTLLDGAGGEPRTERSPSLLLLTVGDSDIRTTMTSSTIKWYNEYSRRLATNVTLTDSPQEGPHQRQHANRQNLAPCPSWLFSSPAFPHRSAPTNPPLHPQAPSPTSLPNPAFSCSSWVVGAVVEAAVGYVELGVAALCDEARTCLSSRAGTQSAKRELKTARLGVMRHAGSTLALGSFGQIG
jgi:hypothetical protein